MTLFCSPPQNGAMDKVMTYLLLVTLAVVVTGLWFLASPAPSYGCSCIVPGTPSEELEKSAAVFTGKVLSIEKNQRLKIPVVSSDDPTDIARQLKVNFKVDRVWKGQADETMSLGTAQYGASCGFIFVEGEEYLVYSRDGVTVSLCSRTKLIADGQEDLDALGAGSPPGDGTSNSQDDTSSPGGCGMAQAASPDLAILGLAAGLIWAGRRKRPR